MAFEVEADAIRNRLQITLSGFASMRDVKRFKGELDEALASLPARRGPHQLLYDVSGATIQSQDVVRALRQLATESPRTSAFALVNASALAGRQLERIFSGADYHVCEDRAQALQWLDDQVNSSRAQ